MNSELTPNTIITQACLSYDVSYVQVMSKKRNRRYVEPRQVSMYLMRTLIPEMSLTDIGRIFRKDHTTVLHAYNHVKTQIEIDQDFAMKVAIVKNNLLSVAGNATSLVFVGNDMQEYKAVYNAYLSNGGETWLAGRKGVDLALAITQQLVDELHKAGYKIAKI